MTTRERLHSDLAIPPGEILEEELEAREMTQKELARSMGRPPQVINEIIRAKKAITPETALDLERVLGISARYWLGLETEYRLTLARKSQLNLSVADQAPDGTLQSKRGTSAFSIAEESSRYGVDAGG